MSNLVAFPVLLPLLTAVVLMALMDRRGAPWVVSMVSGVLLLIGTVVLAAAAASGQIFVLPVGDWPALIGIVWVVDGLSATMLVLTSITSLATLAYAPGMLRPGAETRYFYLLHQFILAGICGSFVTGDFFNLFVFFEIMLLASFVLIALGGRREQLNRTFPYVIVNLVASALFLGGIGAVYGTAGAVNMAVLSQRAASGTLPPVFWAAMTLVIMVFVTKAAIAPLFFWLPDAYPEAPVVVRAFFAGLLTKVGLYTLFRSLPLILGSSPGAVHSVLLVLAAVTMLAGILGALGRDSLSGALAFQVISSVGFIVFGLAIFTPTAVSAGVFYMVHSVLITTALFFAAGIAESLGGTGRLGDVRGLARTHPWLAAAFFTSALALAGMPPLSGFWAKLFLVIAGIAERQWAATTILLVASMFTIGLIMRLWNSVFWGEPGPIRDRPDRGVMVATLTIASAAIVLAITVAPLWTYTERIGNELLQVRPYVDAVMDGTPPIERASIAVGRRGPE